MSAQAKGKDPSPLKAVGVIPSRYGSTRFPGKALELLRGKPLVVHVLDQARRTKTLQSVIVATDDDRIARVIREAGGEAAMTSDACRTGSDRIAEVAKGRKDWDIITNIQGDEPDVEPDVIDRVTQALIDAPACGVSTAMVAIRTEADFLSPSNVKVVVGASGEALYFSRNPLPSTARLTAEETRAEAFVWGMKHLGLYAYRRAALLDFTKWPQTPLEKREQLEQLRFLENGVRIRVVEAPRDSIGVDTPEELRQAERAMARGGKALASGGGDA